MKQETIEGAAFNYAAQRFPNAKNKDCGIVAQEQYACRAGFMAGVEWQRNHVWHKTDEIPKLKKDILVHFESGNMVTMYADKEILDKFKKYYVDYWAYLDDLMPTSFDDILEDNKDVLQQLKIKQHE